MSKRDRKTATSKEPQPSPNRRDTKQLRLAEQEEETMKEDDIMTEKEGPPEILVEDLLTKFDQATEWKRWSTDHNGWIVETTPGPTSEWNDISSAKRKSAQGFLKMDFENTKWNLKLKDGWRDIQKIYKPAYGESSSKMIPFGDDLSRAMRNDTETMFSTKHAKAFRCMMAFSKTDCTLLPGAAFDQGVTLVPSSVISELWFTGINLFGNNSIE